MDGKSWPDRARSRRRESARAANPPQLASAATCLYWASVCAPHCSFSASMAERTSAVLDRAAPFPVRFAAVDQLPVRFLAVARSAFNFLTSASSEPRRLCNRPDGSLILAIEFGSISPFFRECRVWHLQQHSEKSEPPPPPPPRRPATTAASARHAPVPSSPLKSIQPVRAECVLVDLLLPRSWIVRVGLRARRSVNRFVVPRIAPMLDDGAPALLKWPIARSAPCRAGGRRRLASSCGGRTEVVATARNSR